MTRGFVVFSDFNTGKLDYRFLGAGLPPGAIPVYVNTSNGCLSLHNRTDKEFTDSLSDKIREAFHEGYAYGIL